VALVVCYDPRVSWESGDGHNVGEIDAAICASHLMFAAEERGLSTLLVCGYDEAALRETFSIPAAYKVCLILMLGYAREGAHPTYRLHDVRLPIEDTVSFGSFDPTKDRPMPETGSGEATTDGD